MTYFGQSYSRKAFKPVLLFSVLSLFAWSDVRASVTLYCRVLRSAQSDNTVYSKKWATAENGGTGGIAGDTKLFPELKLMQTSSGNSSGWVYYPYGYSSSSSAPYAYIVLSQSSLNVTIPDSYADKVDNIATILNETLSDARRAALTGITLSFDGDGNPSISYTSYYAGRVVGNSVSTYDPETGLRVMSYPDQSGYVLGYVPDPVGSGGFRQVWYDLNHVSNNVALQLDSLSSAQSTQLVYDSTSGQYSFVAPDYSPQLGNIASTLDNIRLSMPTDISPDVIVNPEIIVNPTVTVPAPEVTVNVSAPTQNDITVAVDNSELISSIRDWQESSALSSELLSTQVDGISEFVENINDSLQTDDGSLSYIDDILPATTVEEQAILDVYTGWQTGVPGIAAECDIGLDTLIGPIPQMGSSLDVGQFSVGPYNITLSLTQYASIIAWFRAACLACLLVLFGYNLWNIITQSLQV